MPLAVARVASRRVRSAAGELAGIGKPIAHDDLHDRISAVEWGRLCFLPYKHEARYDIAQQPAKQRMRHGIEVDIGDDLLLTGSLLKSVAQDR